MHFGNYHFACHECGRSTNPMYAREVDGEFLWICKRCHRKHVVSDKVKRFIIRIGALLAHNLIK